MKRNAATIAVAVALALPSLRSHAACRDATILDETIRARSIERQFDDGAADWQDDLARASLVDGVGAPILAGASASFDQQDLFTVHDLCPGDPQTLRPRISTGTAILGGGFTDPKHGIDLRTFLAWSSDGRVTGQTSDTYTSEQLGGVSLATPWADATWARTPDGRQLFRAGTPWTGDIALLDVDRTRAHWLTFSSPRVPLGKGFSVSADAEHRPWQRLDLVTPEVDWTWHDPATPAAAYQTYGSATWRVAPGGLETLRAGGRLVGDETFNQGRDWVSLRLQTELTEFAGVPGAGPLLGISAGADLRAGGRHGCVGITMSTGTNVPETLLDIPAARNRQDSRITLYVRASPTLLRRPRS